MAAKLTFQDIFNDELAPEKFLPLPAYFSTGASPPVFSAPCGSLDVNTTTGGFYLNVSTPTPGTDWLLLSDNVINTQVGHHRTITQTSITVESATNYDPEVGDLIGIFAGGVFTSGPTMNHTYKLNNGCGGFDSTLNCGGDGTNHKLVESFDGATWSNTTNLNISRYAPVDGGAIGRSLGANVFGSVSAAICVGGYTGAAGLSSCELFNGVNWYAGSTNVLGAASGISGMSATGTSYAGVIFGQDFGLGFRFGTKYNGAVWTADPIALPYTGLINGDTEMSASGSVNSAIINSYLISGTYQPILYAYNGSAAYVMTNTGMTAYINVYLGGNPINAIRCGGRDFTAPYNAAANVEVYNGVTFTPSSAMNTARAGSQTKIPGSSSKCVVMGGRASGIPGTAITGLNSSEIYTEGTTYKKLYPQHIKNYNKPSIWTGSGNIINQGYQATAKYPPNKFLVVNKNAITALGNESDLTGNYSVLQVAKSGNLATYSINVVPALQIIPGTIVVIVSSGANPLSANNAGIFVVASTIISSNTIVVANAAATNQNPGTGSIKFITTMVCVDIISPDDIVIGATDNDGLLTLDKFFQNTNYVSKAGL